MLLENKGKFQFNLQANKKFCEVFVGTAAEKRCNIC